MASRLYFDYAASTPIDPAVFRAMKPYLTSAYGNAGSLHAFGQRAIAAVDTSRETIAKALRADFREVIFTGSATEANNLALRGAVKAWRQMQLAWAGSGGSHGAFPLQPRIIISSIEHESVLETARALRDEGVDVVELSVDKFGVVDLAMLTAAITPSTVLVSIMYVNNETGTVQPIQEITKIIAGARAEFAKSSASVKDAKSQKDNQSRNVYPLLHTDASQAFQFLPCIPSELGVDMMTLSAHKLYGPKGIGALYCKAAVPLEAIITGGGQEFGMRSGTENVANIVGFGEAVRLAVGRREEALKHVTMLSQRFYKGLEVIYKKKVPARRMKLNGFPIVVNTVAAHTKGATFRRLPHIINIHTPNQDATEFVMRADLAGLAISSGSACASRSFVASHVLRAMGYSKERALQSIRISFGMPTMNADVDSALRIIRQSIQK